MIWRLGIFSPHRGEPRAAIPGPRDKERELLGALEERGELTSVAAAMRTSLTVDEATAMLDELARRAHLQVMIQDGVLVYALYGRDRRQERRFFPNASAQAGFAAETSPNGTASETAEPLVEPLSERELEVLTLLAAGHSNKEIARDLIVSVGTVKTHTNNIYRKLGVRNRAEALARARGVQLV